LSNSVAQCATRLCCSRMVERSILAIWTQHSNDMHTGLASYELSGRLSVNRNADDPKPHKSPDGRMGTHIHAARPGTRIFLQRASSSAPRAMCDRGDSILLDRAQPRYRQFSGRLRSVVLLYLHLRSHRASYVWWVGRSY